MWLYGLGRSGQILSYSAFRVIEMCGLILCVDDSRAIGGVPTTIQVFTNKMRDEECLQVSDIIEACLGGI